MIHRKSFKNICNMFLAVTFLATIFGCSSQPTNNQNTNTPPQNTNNAQQTPTAVNPTTVLAGTWETKYDISKLIPGYPSSNLGTSAEFAQWKISEGVLKGDEYVGRITNELNNENIAEYTLSSKTITLKFLPVSGSQNASSTGTSRDYEFELSSDGKLLTLKGNDPIILNKGTDNSDMENVSFVISNKVDWMISPPLTIDHGRPEAFYITFETAKKSDSGYTGKIEFWNEDPHDPTVPHPVVATGQYTLSSKDKLSITLNGGSRSATYKLIDNRVLQIDFSDQNEKDWVLTAR